MQEFNTVDEYIQSFPADVQEKLRLLRKVITEEIPDVEEGLSYKMPTFRQNGQYVVYFAGWKKHISVYPFSAEMAKAFPETSNYNTSGKGTIQFPLDKDLPVALIRKIVRFRLQERTTK